MFRFIVTVMFVIQVNYREQIYENRNAMIQISSADDHRVRHYRNLRGTPELHNHDRLFITEGFTATIKVLRSSLPIYSVFALPEFYERAGGLLAERNLPAEKLFTANEDVMNQIVGFSHHSGIMALAEQPPELRLPENLNLLSFPCVALNGIINSENVGAIARNCAAFGVSSLIVDGATSSPYLRRAVRVSMGDIVMLRVFSCDSLMPVLDIMRGVYGNKVYALELDERSIKLSEFQLSPNSALIFGSEGRGIQAELLETCDAIISIPMSGIERGDTHQSLNVAVSTGIVLYELSKTGLERGTR